MVNVFSAYQFRLTNDQLDQLYDIIVKAYATTEKEIWGENYVRIDRETFDLYVQQDQVLVAFIEGRVVGGIRYFHLRDNTWSFSLLGADFGFKGKGIGRALIEAVEDQVKLKGGGRVHIEVLRATNVDIESKKILDAWYKKMGYDLVKTVDVFEVYNDADKWAKLVNPSEFDCYLKELG